MDEERKIDEIRAWFRDQGRGLSTRLEDDGTWTAMFPILAAGSFAPAASGHTELEAARHAVVKYMRLPENAGKEFTPPPALTG